MDKSRGIANIITSIIFKLLLLIANILVRRFIIVYIGNDINGLNSLYISILDFLSVAELGVGSAITFCMYKPIVEGDNEKVSALYHLFTKLYLIIGCIILVCGCAIMPFIKYLAKDYGRVDVNLYSSFALMLISVVLSYVFSAKLSLINAYKNNYITTAISSTGQLVQCGLQIIILLLTKSYMWFLSCRIIAMVLQWIVTELIARKKHGNIINKCAQVDSETKLEVTKNVKAMFMHKIGGVLVNTADSIIISAFIGIIILGKYTNYTTIMTAMFGTITLFFTPLTSIIGHLCVQENKERVKKYFNFFYAFNLIIGFIFFLGYYAVIDNLVTICFGSGLKLGRQISFIITVNYFIQFIKTSAGLFRDADGIFYYDRWRPILEGIVNIGLSIGFIYLFKYLWGSDFAVIGVIAATILTNLFICHIVEPYVLYKYAFDSKAKTHYIRNYMYMALFVGVLFALHYSLVSFENQWWELLVNGCISLAYSLTASLMISFLNKDFRQYLGVIFNKFKLRRGKKSEVAPDLNETDDTKSDSEADEISVDSQK